MSEGNPIGAASPLGDMPPEEFRRHAHSVVDWMADYLAGVGDYAVLPDIRPGDVRGALAAEAPATGEPFEQLFEDFRGTILPGVTHWNHPAFFAYFSVTGSGPGILGEMLSAALNINAMVWQSSPAGTELEIHVLEWLAELLGLPAAFEGTINDTASSSSLYALAAARAANLPEAAADGMGAAPRGRVYSSTEAHSSIDKATIALGFGRTGNRKVEADAEFAMKPASLRQAIEQDLTEGVRPIAVVATLGTTSTTGMDPVGPIADIAAEYGLWLHVDAAYAGPAAIVPEMRASFTGWERADSIVVNPHKWLFTPVDCSVLYCRRPEMLLEAFSVTPEYLKNRQEGVSRNLMDYGISLGRRFRSLKLWFVLRYFGVEGVASRIREHCRLARVVSAWVDKAPDWQRIAPVPFSTVVFRYAPQGFSGEEQDGINHRILDRVNASGEAFLSHTIVHGRIVIRFAIGNLRTTERHVRRAWELLEEAAAAVPDEARDGAPRSPSDPGGRS